MFNVFINDITKNFENNKSTPLKLIDSNIGCLLFADDLLILSETKKGLQHSLNNLSNYCDNWQLAINVNKSKSMIFKQNYTKTKPSFIYYRDFFYISQYFSQMTIYIFFKYLYIFFYLYIEFYFHA